MSAHDVVVVGAGAAGIAAARSLREAGLSVLIVEADDRIGGRAWTVHRNGLPIDLGCGWLHSADRNPWAKLAPALGFAIDRTLPPWGSQYRDLGFPADAQEAAQAAGERFEARLRGDDSGTDRAADLLEPGGPWNPYLEAISGYVNGTGFGDLSIRDYLAYSEADTGINWRVVAGYGALIAAAADGLPLVLGCPVTAIEATGRRLDIVTPRGTISAGAAIVTVPTNVLATGAIRLPAGAADHIEAAGRLPLGLADKMVLSIDRNEDFEPDTMVMGNPHSANTASYHLRPFGRPLIEGFIGGAAARALEPGDAMAAFAIDELAGLFGSAIRARLRPVAQSRWAQRPFSLGSYSHALPGHADARSVLARPWEDRLFFAGEACSGEDFSTAHGAYKSGIAAAQALVAARPSAR